jgi:type I restriction enzyme R subunit
MRDVLKEIAFESVIETHLLKNGYENIPAKSFDLEKCIFPESVLNFIKTTQNKEWTKLQTLLGDKAEDQIIKDLCKWMDSNGSLATLRHGFKCYGKNFRIAYFQSAHGLNPELDFLYSANKLGITRQLRYSVRNSKTIDVVLSVNGIPLITLELKNPFTGQTFENAIYQYKHDRDQRELFFEFKRRTLVHFAVDTELTYMTTRLAGDATFFLPFNKGYQKGAGNPPDEKGRSYRTAYLWEEVLERNSLLDLLARFLHLQQEEVRSDDGRKVKKETLIFPRYHQLQAVRNLIAAAKSDGIGNNYLIEHSAGSGKSNTIAWLAHRLASLHDVKDNRIFDSVIIVTDRRVLDRQLQDTIYQFEHRQGVVKKIDEDSRQLALALKNKTPIIITTLQKFPFVTKQLLRLAEERGAGSAGVLPTRHCAVIIDEAHSSQSGESAIELKGVLGGEALQESAQKQAIEEGIENMEELFRTMAKRGKQDNLSFFAFTATPKHKTLAVFGHNGKAFHKYTMRQAIEEGFVMDVLKNYTTYKAYYKLLKACKDDPNVERKKAAKALARFMRLHPHNISQKTEVMVEHFNSFTRHKIGEKAKAMVVTGSRLEAIRYKQSFDRYIQLRNYPIKTLVAFSGVVLDDKIANVTYTEEQMNGGIKEKELQDAFATTTYQVLLVAEKYQTGFDQPLLHTMYVDKRLAGIQAVQTLSRLNRTHPLKEDTFILDFVNERHEIQEAFAQYYEGAELGERAEPSRMYEIKSELDSEGIYLQEEVTKFCEVFFKPVTRQNTSDHRLMNAALDPGVDRFIALLQENEAKAELYRGKINAFKNLYIFLSQIIPYQDSDLEKLYTFLRYFSTKLPKRKNESDYQFNDEVKLQYYRLQKISEGSISLDRRGIPLDGPTAIGSGLVREQPVPLSKLIDVVNDRFGTDFREADQLFFDQIVEVAVTQENLQQAAKVNSLDKFSLVFGGLLENLFVERMDQNVEIFARYMNDPAFQKEIATLLSAQVYNKLIHANENTIEENFNKN